ncbi:MAG: phosphoribosylamine--glycine ligase [bacterium]|nr:phosphoribosylamine--glycine ligase [bacterium]
MKVLVVGSGGREHTLIWKIKQSSKVTDVICAPGNGGILELAKCFPVKGDDIQGLIELAKSESVDLTVVGPEAPLVEGIVDEFEKNDLKVFGPSAKAAMLEGSKAFANDLMKKYNIPTAEFEVFEDAASAKDHITGKGAPIVVKADGLAAGKGAIVCSTTEEAFEAVDMMMIDKKFGDAGGKVVVEECLFGEEASIFAITDGSNYVILPPSQDHKPVFEGDKGPNTGGMGAYAPAPLVDDKMLAEIESAIIKPTIDAMKSEGIPYKGLLYAGLIITDNGPKVIEFNCRFGDPETQVVLPLLDSDLVELFEASIDGTLDKCSVNILDFYSVCVVAASDGYPGSYEKGKEIYGLETFFPGKSRLVFHSGTAMKDGKLVTNGGRVLCMVATRPELYDAINEAYGVAEEIRFENAYFRKDIGQKGLDRLK